MAENKGNIAIVGLGAMGGSYAMVLGRHGYHVAAVDKDPAAIEYGKEQQIIHQGVVAAPAESSLSAQGATELRAVLGEADAVILGFYSDRILPWLRVHRGLLKPGALITDMAAVKCGFVSEAQAMLPAGCEFIPSHPMAGIEKSGVWNANPTLFARSNFLITPTEQNSQKGIGFAQRLGEILGFSSISILSVDEHDRLVGYASQMPHMLAMCLMLGADDHRLPNVAADSYRNLARIANINTDLWSETFMANTPVLTREIGRFIDNLEVFRRRLANGDQAGVRQLLEQSAHNSRVFSRQKKDGKPG